MRQRLIGLAAAAALAATGLGVAPVADAAQRPAVSGAVVASSSVQAAINAGASAAATKGITTYAAVIDRSTGRILGRTANAGTQVASESLVKMFLAAYYLVQYHGRLPASLDSSLRYMIKYSDDATASTHWTNAAVPLVRNRYGLAGIALAIPNPGYWGKTRITADDVAKFLYKAGKDPMVGPWLFNAMAAAADNGSDDYDQNLGFNTIPGAGSKQGWGHDNWVNGSAAVHSAGFGSRYVAAVLQSGGSATYSVMPGTATHTAQLINTAADKLAKPTTVGIASSVSVALADRTVRLRATASSVGRALVGHKIRFYYRTTAGGPWSYGGVAITDAGGTARLAVSSSARGRAWKAVVVAGTGYAASEPAAKIVYVRRAITGVEKLPATAARNHVLVLHAKTGVGYAGQKVRLQHITSKGWVSDGASIVAADGSFSIYFRTSAAADVRYYRAYISLQPGSYQALTWSLVTRVIVR